MGGGGIFLPSMGVLCRTADDPCHRMLAWRWFASFPMHANRLPVGAWHSMAENTVHRNGSGMVRSPGSALR
jgi:hypothetical protein